METILFQSKKIPVQNIKTDSGRATVRLEPNAPCRPQHNTKTLRLIADAPRYVSNQTLHVDLSITTVEEERQKRVDKHFQRLQEHENQLAINLVDIRNSKRLKRIWPCDLRGD